MNTPNPEKKSFDKRLARMFIILFVVEMIAIAAAVAASLYVSANDIDFPIEYFFLGAIAVGAVGGAFVMGYITIQGSKE